MTIGNKILIINCYGANMDVKFFLSCHVSRLLLSWINTFTAHTLRGTSNMSYRVREFFEMVALVLAGQILTSIPLMSHAF